MVFRTKNSSHFTLYVGCKDKYIQEMVKKDFLDLQIDNHRNWKNRTGQVILKLSATCYAFQSMVHISNINTLKLICYRYFHSVLKYGIIVGSK